MKLFMGAIPLVALLGVMPVFGAAPIVRSTVQDLAQAQTDTPVVLPLEDRLQLVERRMQMLTDILMRLDRIQQEMQQLRGDVEMQGHALESLKKRQRDLYGDIDRRMMQLTGKRPPAVVPTSPYPVPAPSPEQTAGAAPMTDKLPLVSPSGAGSPATTQMSPQDVPVEELSASSTAATASIVKQTPAAEVVPGVVVYSPDSAAPAVATPVSPPADPALEQPMYKQAFDLLMQRRYEEAKQAFRVFLRQYPNGRLAANAQYWVGEASYVTRDFATALDEFTKVVQVYPTSPKVSDSLLKIAFIQYEQKEWAKARETLEMIIKQHATTTAARLARKRLERMRIEGN
ncbi:tol-pal system protein YbgF [Pseudomonadota bacterium]